MKMQKLLVALVFLMSFWLFPADATDQVSLMRWFDLLNQRLLLSEEIAAYQYRHALDPPEVLTPPQAPVIAYAKYLGINEAYARAFLQEERKLDQHLQQVWLHRWQHEGFAFGSADFFDAPSLCQKQERLERQMLREMTHLRDVFSDPSAKSNFAKILHDQLLVPHLTAREREHLLSVLFAEGRRSGDLI